MSFDNIVVGDYGQWAELTIIDVDTKAAADISSYSQTQTMIFTKPDGTEQEGTAAFSDTGEDGKIKYKTENGLFSLAGEYRVRARVESPTAILSTEEHKFTVLS
jgi:hypothetical protein